MDCLGQWTCEYDEVGVRCGERRSDKEKDDVKEEGEGRR
jgi:hypothetical protein